MASNTNTDVDKLITFGHMALEQGWYEQARQCFQQALALDASNQEAMSGLARMNEVFRRKILMPRERALPLGGLATIEGVRVSVDGYEFALSYEDEYRGQITSEEGATFLWIHVHAENVRNVTTYLPEAHSFRLVYKGNEIHSYTPWSVTGREAYQAESVLPGMSRAGWVLYEIPDAAPAHDILVRWYRGPWEEPKDIFWGLGS